VCVIRFSLSDVNVMLWICAVSAEFRQQLEKLEALAQRVPRCVIQDVVSAALSESSAEQERHTAQFDELKDHLDSLKVSRCSLSKHLIRKG
jgi:uncharacterized protein YqfA (UPF0365 family)